MKKSFAGLILSMAAALFPSFLFAQNLVPPAAVSNLSGAGVPDARSAILTWTTPGADGTSGNLVNARYQINYSVTGPISTEAQWLSAYYGQTLSTTCSPGIVVSYRINYLSSSGTTYWFCIKTRDPDNNWSSISNSPEVTMQVFPPGAVTDLTGLPGEASVTLAWTSPGDDGTSGFIDGYYYIKSSLTGPILTTSDWNMASYETYASFESSPGVRLSAYISDLNPGTTYWFALATYDDGYNQSGISNSPKLTCFPDVTPPVLSSVTVLYVAESFAMLSWRTNEWSEAWVEYGLTSSYGMSTSTSSFLKNHQVSISNLLPGSTYHCRILARDHSTNLAVSSDTVFATLAGIQGGNEYVWLHADGKYIRRSPLCSDPNGIWMGCSVAHRSNYSNVNMAVEKAKVEWISQRHVNVSRVSVSNVNWPTIEECVSEYIAPIVNWYKEKKIYTIIDSHYYMHDTDSSDNPQVYPLWDVDKATMTWCARWLADWQYMANYFKNEPWVAGYELCNEPVIISSANFDGNAHTRKNYMKCIQLIRQIDTRHILFLGGNNWSHGSSLKDTWEVGLPAGQQFNPDPLYKQAVFIFHEYPKFFDLYEAAGGLVNYDVGRVQNSFNVPLMCTEFGSADIVGGITEAEKRQFEQEMIELCYGEPDFWKNAPLADKAYPSRGTPAGRRISWSLWYLNGNNETQWANSSRWTDIWTYAAEMQASPPPEPLTPNPPNVYPEGKIITAYPNPFSLKSASPVKFHIGSAAGGEIKIFTVSSRLVKKIAVPEGDSNVLWDCLNKDSEKIAPGLYLYSFSENNGAKTTGKIAIIK